MANSRPTIPERRTRWAWWVATCGGLGYLRPGPGTWTSLAAALVWWAMAVGFAGHFPAWLIANVALVVLATIAGIPASTIVERESGAEDPGFVTVDEAAGQWLACLPGVFLAHSPLALLEFAGLALLLFRIFDIAKPWPVRKFEALHGGTGIMLDDIAAGAYAVLVEVAFVAAWMHFRHP